MYGRPRFPGQSGLTEEAKPLIENIDPRHDWSTTETKTITVTPPTGTVEIKVLTEAPFGNPDARTLMTVPVSDSGPVTLSFDSPGRLGNPVIAFVKDTGSWQIRSPETSATTRTSRAASAWPSEIPLSLLKAFPSYNAVRTARNFNVWSGTGWIQEILLGQPGETGTIWRPWSGTLDTGSLGIIFKTYLDSPSGNKHKNNLDIIRNSQVVRLWNNQLLTTGDPVVVSPVLSTSSDCQYSDIYYYYYDQSKPMPDLQVIPKFKAIPGYQATSGHYGDTVFYKTREYLLPYYGDPDQWTKTEVPGYVWDGKVWTVRNGSGYYLGSGTKLSDSVYGQYQYWMIYKNPETGAGYMYNVGASAFLTWTGSYDVMMSGTSEITESIKPFVITNTESGWTEITRDGTVGLGTDIPRNTGVWSDKTLAKTGDNFKWYFTEITEGLDTLGLPQKLYQVSPESVVGVPAIPKGYRLGFMLRKAKIATNDSYARYPGNSWTKVSNGEVWADGRLNNEINRFTGHFGTSASGYTMKISDPRASVFSANSRTFVTFEDGSDCTYNDFVLEISSGVEEVPLDSVPNSSEWALCFEDRLGSADYDLNDVVLRCSRVTPDSLELSLVACGASDNIVIHGATGWKYDGHEAHEIFGKSGFVNTQNTGVKPVRARVKTSLGVVEYLKGIWLENKSTGKIIKVSGTGDQPFGIIVPEDFKYPQERVSVLEAYPQFATWAQDRTKATTWYLEPVESKVLHE